MAVEVRSRKYPSHVSFIIQECGECVAPLQPVPRVLLFLCRGLTTGSSEQEKLQFSAQLLITWAFAIGEGLIDLAVEGVIRVQYKHERFAIMGKAKEARVLYRPFDDYVARGPLAIIPTNHGVALLEIPHQIFRLSVRLVRQRSQKMITLGRNALCLGEPLAGFDGQVSLPGTAIERSRRSLNVWGQSLEQVTLRADLLLRVRDTEDLIQVWIELNFATPPVVIILPMLVTHKEPTIVNLTASAHNRDAGALRDPSPALLFIR